MTARQRIGRWLTETVLLNRAVFYSVCGVLGLILGLIVWLGLTEANHAREQRQRQAQINRRQDITDLKAKRERHRLRLALHRLERLERGDLQRLLNRLGPRQTRALVTQLEQLASAAPGSSTPPDSSSPPRTGLPGRPAPGRRPIPPPRPPTSPSLPSPPSRPNPAPGGMLPSTIDPDGGGPLPPVANPVCGVVPTLCT